MNLDKNKVVLLMSGGLDSSLTAKLLIDKGFEVIGMTMNQLDNTEKYFTDDEKKLLCTDGATDAKEICDLLNIQHVTVNFSDTFSNIIVNNFVDEYMAGRTPNPCALCNTTIKWDLFLKEADKLGAHYIATGHYTQIRYDADLKRYILSKGIDDSKDQSYVQWNLKQEQLERTLFPLGNSVKTDNKKLAETFELPVFNKPESQDICFIAGKYQNFLEKIEPKSMKLDGGDIILNGEVIGKHKGYPFYTIGQRRGLGVSYAEPLYVKSIDAKNNTIEVAVGAKISNKGLLAYKLNLIKYDTLDETKLFKVKIRYNDPGHDAYCKINEEGHLEVTFVEKRKAITPGQSVVIFEDNDIVGGAVIEKALD